MLARCSVGMPAWVGVSHTLLSAPVLQVELAVETEINTGPAWRSNGSAPAQATAPPAAAPAVGDSSVAVPPPVRAAPPAAAAAAEEDDDYDPLEAFMAEVNQEVAANKPNKPSDLQEVQQCDDVADPATEYMEVGVWGWGGVQGSTWSCVFLGVQG